MASHPSLSGFGGDSVETGKLGPVICKLIGQLFPDVLTVSFQTNRLSSLKPFQTLSQWCPLVQNLSFRDNLLQSYRDIEGLKGSDMTNLRELMLTGNPVREREVKRAGGEADYRNKIKQMFPSIQILDQQDYEEEISLPGIGTTAETNFTEYEKGSFMDSVVTADTVQDFILKYFNLFDKNRGALSDLYADGAFFSLAVNSMARKRMPHQTGRRFENYDGWTPINRNHVTVKDMRKRMDFLASGPTAIIQAFGRLPTTLHPVYSAPEKKMFVADAFQLPVANGVILVLTIHGEFNEVDVSRAAMAGWQYSILNDTLTVRHWAQDRVWVDLPLSPMSASPTNGPLVGSVNAGARRPKGMTGVDSTPNMGGAPAAAPAPTGTMSLMGPTPAAAPAGPPMLTGALPNDGNILAALKNGFGLDDAKHNLVLQLAQATGLNYQFACRCLTQTQWDPSAAMNAFSQVRDTIPQEAFMYMPV
ncbi:nuclear mRNA export, poly(A)+RNA binding protein [Blyttiomyces sp. JEL0837]|nr:nuclear mRNA export, poly(A)+RNA binding protein [Blyttiomyces sp. JEL0837]